MARILKKDLKRKRAMNVILLVFIILASMFMSSGVSNIITVTTALEFADPRNIGLGHTDELLDTKLVYRGGFFKRPANVLV